MIFLFGCSAGPWVGPSHVVTGGGRFGNRRFRLLNKGIVGEAETTCHHQPGSQTALNYFFIHFQFLTRESLGNGGA